MRLHVCLLLVRTAQPRGAFTATTVLCLHLAYFSMHTRLFWSRASRIWLLFCSILVYHVFLPFESLRNKYPQQKRHYKNRHQKESSSSQSEPEHDLNNPLINFTQPALMTWLTMKRHSWERVNWPQTSSPVKWCLEESWDEKQPQNRDQNCALSNQAHFCWIDTV